jgi:hypothetical protein
VHRHAHVVELEAPGPDEGEVVVDPSVDAVAQGGLDARWKSSAKSVLNTSRSGGLSTVASVS